LGTSATEYSSYYCGNHFANTLRKARGHSIRNYAVATRRMESAKDLAIGSEPLPVGERSWKILPSVSAGGSFPFKCTLAQMTLAKSRASSMHENNTELAGIGRF
jgi:hypothetical protein